MKTILRNCLAVVVGLVLGGIVNTALVMAGPHVIPPPAGVDMSDAKSLAAGVHLLAPAIIECVAKVKKDILGQKTVSLDLEETLIALGISVTTNPSAQLCLDKLKRLRGCDIHMTHIPTPGDEGGLRRLGVHLTSDPNFSTKNLFVS